MGQRTYKAVAACLMTMLIGLHAHAAHEPGVGNGTSGSMPSRISQISPHPNIPAEKIEVAAEQIVKRREIQAQLPRDVITPITPTDDKGIEINLPNISAWVVWAVLAIIVAAVLYSLRDQLVFWQPKKEDDWKGDPTSAQGLGGQSLAQVSASADELAQQGLYMEAIHLLLLRSLAEMRQRLKAQFAESLTSREILKRTNLVEGGRLALQDIITRVEHCYFGEYPVGLEDYTACKLSFDSFVQHLGTGKAA